MQHIYTVMAQKHLLAETSDSNKARVKLPSLTVLQSSSSLGFPMPKLWDLCGNRPTNFLDLLLFIMASTSNLAPWDCKATWKDGLCLAGTLCISSPNQFNLVIQDYNINFYQHNQIRGGGKGRNCSICSRISLSRPWLCYQHLILEDFNTTF